MVMESDTDNILVEWRINEALQNTHPMHFAARRGDVEVIKALLRRGYFANCVTFELVTPLHEAASQGHLAAVEVLLSEGAWVNATNIDGATPLCDACAAGHTEVARVLVEHDAFVNAPMVVPMLNSPLHEAVMKGNIGCVNLLLSKGARFNECRAYYGTPLHAACAAFIPHLDCISALIQAGADVNATILHKTPLHIAAYRNSVPMVQLLLNHGANVYLLDNAGKKARELARVDVVREILFSYEAHPRSLLDCCRLRILQSFVVGKGDHYIKELGLPRKIVEYILDA